jgi:hypothetical protein
MNEEGMMPTSERKRFVIFYGYHPEETFSKHVGEKIRSLNPPNISAVRIHGIPNRRGQVIEQVDSEIRGQMEKMKHSVFIVLHTADVDARMHPHQPKAIVVLGREFLGSTRYLRGKFGPADIDFYSTLAESSLAYTSVEFYPNNLLGVDEGVDLLLGFIKELSILIEWERNIGNERV